jgi:DegV family protein with EDD domain
MKELDGRHLFDTFICGALRVIAHQDTLNRINVFPVPDGDTGTNFSMTLANIMETTTVSDSVGETALSMSDAAITGARGNSGAIFAQFLSGIAEYLSQSALATMEHFARAVENASRSAYAAIANPTEGTILSVIRDWSRSLSEHAREAVSFHELFHRSLPAAAESLRRTPERLAVLREAGVVDAGAQGFYHFLRGAAEFLATGKRPVATADRPTIVDDVHDTPLSEEGLRFRYCTEVMLRREGGHAGALKEALARLGDSLIVAEAGTKTRVHIHTDRPADVVELLGGQGRILQQKVDDMRGQYAVAHQRKHSIALVTDSTCDLPPEVLDRYQIHVLPLRLTVGDTEYLDRVTLQPERFLELMRTGRKRATTSQPPAAESRRLFAFLASHYDSLIVIHVASKMSGTCEASRREAEKIAGKRITVIDSRTLSGSLGLLVLRAAEAIAAGATHDDVVATVEASIPKARILVGVPTLAYMVRGGRVSPLKGFVARLLNLKPIVSVDSEGKSVFFGKAFSMEGSLRSITHLVAEEHGLHPLRAFAVVHAGAREKAGELAERLGGLLGMKPAYVMEISPVISANSGPGALSVVTMRE